MNGNTFLITEAVRGAGAKLKNSSGARFMNEYDSRKELAPRDIVARAIQKEIQKQQEKYVALDLSLIHISEPTRLLSISYAVFCLKKKKKKTKNKHYVVR